MTITIPEETQLVGLSTYLPSVLHTSVVTPLDDGTVAFTYAHEDDEGDHLADLADMGLVWREFTSEADRDAFIAEQRAQKVAPSRIFVVNHMEHGLHDYSVAYQLTHAPKHYRPADRWDTRPSGVLVIPADVSVNYRIHAAVNACKVITAMANGEWYGITTDYVRLDGEDGWIADRDDETVWGYLDCGDLDQTIRGEAPSRPQA